MPVHGVIAQVDLDSIDFDGGSVIEYTSTAVDMKGATPGAFGGHVLIGAVSDDTTALVELQHSNDGTHWSRLDYRASVGLSASAKDVVIPFPICRRFVRAKVKPDLTGLDLPFTVDFFVQILSAAPGDW